MMESWQQSIINRKRDVENLFTLASDHRIFPRNLSFRVYWHVWKYFRNQKLDIYGEIFSPGPKKSFTFSISYFLFIIANSCSLLLCRQCEPWDRVSLIIFLNCSFFWNLKKNSGERNPLSNYLSIIFLYIMFRRNYK